MPLDIWLRSNVGYLVVVMSAVGLSVFLIIGTSAVKDYAWRSTIARYMDDISKEEIRKRDDTIKRLTVELEDETRQCESLRGKVKSMAALNEKSIEFAGETYRRQLE